LAAEAFLAAAILVLLPFAFFRARKSRPSADSASAEDPPEAFYHPYTTAFDRVCRGEDLLSLLAAEGLDTSPPRQFGSADALERQREFALSCSQAPVDAVSAADLSGTGICVLVDQSGSMAPVMPRLAGELLAALECLEAAGAATMLAGFTTIGWKGNRARRQWLGEGSPPYPGRLCDLLHIVYSDFGEAIKAEQLAPLLEPAVFFENVDGEAISWAERQLLGRSDAQRFLIVVSDGAPVDDSSLHANGPNFLWRHLNEVVGDCLERREIALGGIGIGHDVRGLFPTSRKVTVDGGLASAIVDLAAELIACDQSGTDEPGKSTSPS
jgi:cobaltochelatase CobT